MGWLEKTYNRIAKGKKKIDVPDGLWTKCPGCAEIVYNKILGENFQVCPKCGYHFYIGAWKRLEITVDENSFARYECTLRTDNILGFPGYDEKLRIAVKKTDLDEAALIGGASIGEHPISLVITDFGFVGGSMGSVVGERITLAADNAAEKGIPLVIISGSGGGARMQEGVVSLMQMAKVSSAIAELKSGGGLYISVLTHPTMGGALASFASRGDIILAEPGALIGFAGPRVIKQTIKQQLPRGFQRADALMKHGMIDLVVERKNMRETLIKLLNLVS